MPFVCACKVFMHKNTVGWGLHPAWLQDHGSTHVKPSLHAHVQIHVLLTWSSYKYKSKNVNDVGTAVPKIRKKDYICRNTGDDGMYICNPY